MKKILLLGGSAQQVIAIRTAKKLGYYTVLCDYLSDNPGQYVADKFYLESTTDMDKMLEIAQIEKVDGVLAYASDPAAPTAAYIAEKMGLPGNNFESVSVLCNKDKFRDYLKSHNFNAPMSKGYDDIDLAYKDIAEKNYFEFPIIIKPVDSSGSKGATVLNSSKNIQEACKFAMDFSRSKKIIVEEFIEKKHPYLIGGDILINNGKVVLWGLMNCQRDNHVNPLVPVGKSYPPKLDKIDLNNIKDYLQRLITSLGIQSGAMNVELIVDKNNRVFPIDIGPRSGGNMIPDLLGYIFHVNIVEMLIKLAMGEHLDSIENNLDDAFYATYNVHAVKDGIFDHIDFSDKLEPYIFRKEIYKKSGDGIEYFDNAAKVLGIIFLKFNSQNEMMQMLENIENEIKIVYQ